MSIPMSATNHATRLASLFHRNKNEPSDNTGMSARLEEPAATTSEQTFRAAEGGAALPLSRSLDEPDQITRASRRRYTREDKLRILRLADACKERGQLGALLRREGLYHSTLRDFQEQRANGRLEPA